MKGRIEIREERCKACGLCIEYCPKGILEFSEKFNLKGYTPVRVKKGKEDECTGCATCALVCPDCVIEVYRE